MTRTPAAAAAGHSVRWPRAMYRWDWAARNESRYLARRAYARDMRKFMKWVLK